MTRLYPFLALWIIASMSSVRISAGVSLRSVPSCYFDTPPTYNANTKFPNGFDPVGNGWKKAR
jgi:hypothetical protein